MNGEPDWYEQWIAPVEDQMIRSIWRVVQHEQDAQDVLQIAVATVWKKLSKVQSHPNPQALVVRIAIDAARDWLRRKMRFSRYEVLGLSFSWMDRKPLMSETLEKDELEFEILQAIVCLPNKQCTAVWMRIVEERSYDEIAQVLNCSEITARIHVSKGRNTLSVRLPHLCPDITVSSMNHE